MIDEVTQADRDAAAELARELKLRSCSERGDMIAGRDDDDHLIQAFARHRTNTELVEALRLIAAGVEKRMHDGTTVVDDHPDAMEIARKALSLYGDER